MTIFDVYFDTLFVGKLSIDKAMRMTFEYDDDYIEQQAPAISLTLPINKKCHGDETVFPFIENLLPEGEIRTLIQHQNKIEEGNFSRFIELLGGDVAGAISIQLKGDCPKSENPEQHNELSKQALSQLLIDIQDRPFNAYPHNGDVGNRLSLAGAQNKLPVICKAGKILEASDAPSTHIIKPARKDSRFQSLVYNEYICMKAAKKAGINVANVSLLDVIGINGIESDALLIERFDRLTSTSGDDKIVTKRLQQEDLCQLCSLPSTMKYEGSGGPGFVDLFMKINQLSAIPVKDDIEVFKRLIFNLIIGNYDAHAKNFSFLVADNGEITLAPAYDLVCTALYEELDTTFAMHIGDCREIAHLNVEAFELQFQKIHKKFQTIRKQLIKYADLSMQALSEIVDDFRGGEFYSQDINAAEKILSIGRRNYQYVIDAL